MFPRVAVSPYPRVPRLPGVPNVRRSQRDIISEVAGLGASIASLNLMVSDNLTNWGISLMAQWGVFSQSGQPVAVWDNVISVDYRHEMRISTYPVEQGGFQSFNKVQTPYDARVQFSVGSGSAARHALLTALEQAVTSLDLYTVVTPDFTYPNANLVHLDYRREARKGVSLLVVDVWLEEVRTTAVQATSNETVPDSINDPQNAPSDVAQDDGSVQSPDATIPGQTTASDQTTGDQFGAENIPQGQGTGTSPMPTLNTSDPASTPQASVPANMPTNPNPATQVTDMQDSIG